MKIIFLDFDGVMDTTYYSQYAAIHGLPETDKYGVLFDPECVRCLEKIICKTHADIVISSSWKDVMDYSHIFEMWKERGLPGFVIDVTPTCSRRRGDEIDEWINECRDDCDYVIIDDLNSSCFNAHQLDRLFIVDSYRGLTEDVADKIISILQ